MRTAFLWHEIRREKAWVRKELIACTFNLSKRRLIVSNSGMLGITYAHAKVGDQLCFSLVARVQAYSDLAR